MQLFIGMPGMIEWIFILILFVAPIVLAIVFFLKYQSLKNENNALKSEIETLKR
jgi:regulatory protein YycI of two-component signal transduction system YycFG